MGMDVYGLEPQTDAGEYFRNNVWYWRPLWSYCLKVGDAFLDPEVGHDNSGDSVSADQAMLLAEMLKAEIESGRTAEYKRNYDAHLASLPRSECQYCEGTGIRSDGVGVNHGMPDRVLEHDLAIMLGRTTGWCNACNGEGKVDAFETNYPFDVNNVIEFAEFCAESGGFQIC